MPRPTPITTTDELLVELVDEVVGLRKLLGDRLAVPGPDPQDAGATVELREPADTAAPASRPGLSSSPGPAATTGLTEPHRPAPTRRAPARKRATGKEGGKP